MSSGGETIHSKASAALAAAQFCSIGLSSNSNSNNRSGNCRRNNNGEVEEELPTSGSNSALTCAYTSSSLSLDKSNHHCQSTRQNQIFALKSNVRSSLSVRDTNNVREQQAGLPGTRTLASRLSWYRKVAGASSGLIWPTAATTTGNKESAIKGDGDNKTVETGAGDAVAVINSVNRGAESGVIKKRKRSKGKKKGSIIVHASNNFVDKLAHIIKKSSTFTGVTRASESKHLEQHRASDIGAGKHDSEGGSRDKIAAVATAKKGVEEIVLGEEGGGGGGGKKTASKESSGFSVLRGRLLGSGVNCSTANGGSGGGGAAGSNSSSSSISSNNKSNASSYLIGGLSWRLVKRCAANSKQDKSGQKEISIGNSSNSDFGKAALKFNKSAEKLTPPRSLTSGCCSEGTIVIAAQQQLKQRDNNSERDGGQRRNLAVTNTTITEQQQQHRQQPSPSQPSENLSSLTRQSRATGGTISKTTNSSSSSMATINLAALAAKSPKFHCSASVGNLWSSHGSVHQQRRELAELSGDAPSSACRPLDYTPRAAFDTDPDQTNISDNNNNNNNSDDLGDGKAGKSAKKGRKNSTNRTDKRNRQKEAEKVEKLRLLVSYLNSGTSQQLLNPVALEEDELKLAEDYKLHLTLCDDCLQANDRDQQTSRGSIGNANSFPNFLTATGTCLTRSRTPDTGDGGSVAGSFSGSSGACGCGAGGSVSLNVPGGSYHRHSSDYQSAKLFYIDDMERKDSDSSDTSSQLANCAAVAAAVAVGASGGSGGGGGHNQHQFGYGISNPNSGCSINNPYHYHAHHHIHYQGSEKGRQTSSKGTISSSEAIRDMPSRSWSSEMFLSSTPTIATTVSTNTTTTTGQPLMGGSASNLDPTLPANSISNSNINNNNNNTSHSGVQLDSAEQKQVETGAGQPMPAAISKTSAWTNPQNLATWIDNEVKSLVSDLEAKSHLVKSEKQLKSSSKRKWLSSSSRRNSSGAHST